MVYGFGSVKAPYLVCVDGKLVDEELLRKIRGGGTIQIQRVGKLMCSDAGHQTGGNHYWCVDVASHATQWIPKVAVHQRFYYDGGGVLRFRLHAGSSNSHTLTVGYKSDNPRVYNLQQQVGAASKPFQTTAIVVPPPQCRILNLPDEMLDLILLWMDVQQLLAMGAVCKSLYNRVLTHLQAICLIQHSKTNRYDYSLANRAATLLQLQQQSQ